VKLLVTLVLITVESEIYIVVGGTGTGIYYEIVGFGVG